MSSKSFKQSPSWASLQVNWAKSAGKDAWAERIEFTAVDPGTALHQAFHRAEELMQNPAVASVILHVRTEFTR